MSTPIRRATQRRMFTDAHRLADKIKLDGPSSGQRTKVLLRTLIVAMNLGSWPA
ncbi:hypothetical protein [Cupriavidus pinatubonensis]|uniref:Uncharacterized protein n=1 Tax=Cupriavidus pinatubonensis TaxID=248026 RepID=A0ABN7XTZ7_9BURK|nr:hypothetical protein [Cupriavidus pinatubonensis]CAG9163848.1 hypothetical protein LMG23994_00304 [Cupriavidus pinatubonensis]